MPLSILYFLACTGGSASSPSTPTTSTSDTAISGTTSSPSTGATADTGSPVECDFTYPHEDDCTEVYYGVWDVDKSCWYGVTDRRPSQWWADWNDWTCLPVEPSKTPLPDQVTTYWMTDIEACVEFVYLVDECAVDDPAIRPCDEAPFDCCGVEDSFTAPECK